MAYLGQQLPLRGVANRSTFTASGSETSVNVESTYVVGQLDVYMNGIKLVDGDDYIASNGTSITGLTALSSGDIIEFVALDTFSAANMISPSGGTFSGDVTIANGTNDLDIASHDGTNGLKLEGVLVTATAAELNLLDGKTSVGSPSITDNGNATAMTIDTSEDVTYTGNIIMPTNKKVKQKGAFMQSSTHQALTLGY